MHWGWVIGLIFAAAFVNLRIEDWKRSRTEEEYRLRPVRRLYSELRFVYHDLHGIPNTEDAEYDYSLGAYVGKDTRTVIFTGPAPEVDKDGYITSMPTLPPDVHYMQPGIFAR